LTAYSYIKNIENYPDTKLKFSTLSSLNVLFKKLEEAHEKLLLKDESIVAILKDLIDSIGLLEYVLTLENGEDRIQNIKSLLDQLTSYFKEDDSATLESFLENIALASSQDEIKEAAKVKMMTIHAAKGVEFQHVFVVGVNERTFPSSRTLMENPIHGLEEERRLCYVALTRARKRLFVTCNYEYSFITETQGEPSRFFKEAGLSFYKKSNTTSNPMKDFKFLSERKPANTQPVQLQNNEPSKKNNTSWRINDRLKHVKFGLGKVIDIMGDILVIDFAEHGIKKIVSYYVGIEKVNIKEVEL
jgi:DNA helicase-2/ATP-dependent DNA helicase PcrA